MNERRDDTTKPAGESRPTRAPGDYYYDDATGYEIYRPEDEAGDESPAGEEESDEPRAGTAKAVTPPGLLE